jgi:NADPH2:quinone reductase
MRSVVATSFGGPDALEVVEDTPEPPAQEHRVRIDVEWAGVSFPDLLQSRGEYQTRPELPFIPGWEVAGVVREDAAGFMAGDKVAAMPVVGGFAETVSVDPSMVFRLPDAFSMRSGAALPLNYLTAHFALVRRGRLRSGEVVLVHGAAGGVGSAACQLALAYGARVIAIVSTPEKASLVRSIGVHDVIEPKGFRDDVRRLTDGRGVDLVVDPVGGDRFTDSLRSLSAEGRVLVLGFAGRDIPTVKVNRLLLGNTSVIGVGIAEAWRTDPGFAAEQWRDLYPMMESGALDPPISEVFSLSEAASALDFVDQRRAVGKVLLQVRGA